MGNRQKNEGLFMENQQKNERLLEKNFEIWQHSRTLRFENYSGMWYIFIKNYFYWKTRKNQWFWVKLLLIKWYFYEKRKRYSKIEIMQSRYYSPTVQSVWKHALQTSSFFSSFLDFGGWNLRLTYCTPESFSSVRAVYFTNKK